MGSRHMGFSGHSTWAQQLWHEGSGVHRLQQLWYMGFVALWHVGPSWIRD